MMSFGNETDLGRLESVVKEEIDEETGSMAEQELELPVAEWAYDPTEVEREDVRLRSLLGAVETLKKVHLDAVEIPKNVPIDLE